VGWDEILAPGMDPSAVVMSWRGVDGGTEATKRGNDSVMAPWPMLYFDFSQRRGVDEPPGRTNSQTLETVYRFEPAPATLSAEQRGHVLGLEAAVWTEHIRTEPRVVHMTYPRAAAVAEAGWSLPERRDWNDFLRRMPAQLRRYDALGLAAADSAFAVEAKRDYDLAAGSATVTLATQSGLGEIRYTLDDSEPVATSPRYAKPLVLKLPATVRAAAYAGGQRLSRSRRYALDRASAQHRSSRELELCSDAIGLSLEDDAARDGQRAIFDLDLMGPCWMLRNADLDAAASVEAAVGSVPFNFRIGKEVEKIRFPEPATAAGELNVYLDSCEGERIASLPLGDPAHVGEVSLLRRVALSGQRGRHDLCFRFAQPALEPLNALDWVRLVPREDASP
jgi:hexosaminidase